MELSQNKIIAILGPTSSGKSDLAIRLARKFNGEIISADSRQVYRGLDLTTGKVTKQEQRMAKHYCLDIVDPPKRWKGGVQPFTLQQYRRCADAAIHDIWKRGKIPILVGGTQLYVRSVLYEYDIPPVPPDPSYRKKLEEKSLKVLQQQLYRADLLMKKWKDRQNKRRVIRALEIYHSTKQKPSEWYIQKADSTPISRYNVLQLCIDVPREKLYKRIDRRVDTRIKRGMVREVERLQEQGISKEWLKSLGLECRFISEYLDGAKTLQRKRDMIGCLKFATHHFARRQLTWYRNDNDITHITSYAQAVGIISRYLLSAVEPHCARII